jgi:glycosyltransferase involved in cell wall biosynthesis
MKKPKTVKSPINFSIALIARNEEKTLPRLLRSLEEFKKRGGEVVLLDTGSKDKTAKIAKDWGCKVEEVGDKFRIFLDDKTVDEINSMFVVEEEERIVNYADSLFDFGAARNYAANMASNDMVSMPDCDEEFTAFNIDKIQEEINKGADQIEFNFVFSHDNLGREAIKFVQCKFFNRKKLQWKGKIHEVLAGNASKRIFLGEDTLKIEHWQNQETPRGSYLKGLAYDCYLDPTYDRNSHYFGRELMWCNRPKSAIKELQRHLTIGWWKAEKAQSMVFIGDCTENEEEKLNWYHKAFLEEPARRISLLRLAQHFYGKDHMKCACYASAALQIPYNGFYADDIKQYKELPHELLYCSLGWMNRQEESKYHYDKAVWYAPNNPKYINDRKYYYKDGYQDIGIQGWMTQAELNWLFEKAKTVNTILEVGSWKGRSTHALLSGCKGTVTAVDTFKGTDDEGDLTNSIGKKEDIYAQFQANVGHFKNLEVFKMTSEEAAEKFKDRKWDMIFIDANHTYEGVEKDIEMWKDKATIIISGHDYCPAWPGVMKAVEEHYKDVTVHDSIWSKIVLPTVSIIVPTLGRPDGLKILKNSIDNLNYPKDKIEVIIEEDEKRIGVPRMVKKLFKRSRNDFICYMANDTEFTPDALLNAIKESISKKKRLVSFNTGEFTDKGNICEHFIIRRSLVEEIGDIFDTDFHHVGVDTLLWAICTKLNEAVCCREAVVHHNHFSRPGKQGLMDEIYTMAYKNAEQDRELLKKKLEKI